MEEHKNETEQKKNPQILKKEIEHLNNKIVKFRWWGWILSFIIGGALFYGLSPIFDHSYWHKSDESFIQDILPYIFLGGFFADFMYFYLVFFFSSKNIFSTLSIQSSSKAS